MTTLATPDIDTAAPVSLQAHPIAKLLAAVRERCRARNLNFVVTDQVLAHARSVYHGPLGTLASAIDAGQRKADSYSKQMRGWKNPTSPEAA